MSVALSSRQGYFSSLLQKVQITQNMCDVLWPYEINKTLERSNGAMDWRIQYSNTF